MLGERDLGFVGGVVTTVQMELGNFAAKTFLERFGAAAQCGFDDFLPVGPLKMTRCEIIFLEQLRNQHVMDDGRIKITAAESVITRDRASLDCEGTAGGGWRKARNEYVTCAAAEIEYDDILWFIPNFRTGAGEKIICERRHGFVEKVEIRQDKPCLLGCGQRVRPLVDWNDAGTVTTVRPGGEPVA